MNENGITGTGLKLIEPETRIEINTEYTYNTVESYINAKKIKHK